MKLLKTYISLAVINVICVISVVNYGPSFKHFVFSSVAGQMIPAGSTVTPAADISPTPVVTPKPPKKRIVRVVRNAASSPAAGTVNDPQAQAPDPQAGGNGGSQQPAAANPTSAPASVQDNRCLIGIDGAQYDVSSYRSMHPGGDIFNCGADMSGAFWSQHGASTLSKMAKYRL